MLSRAKNRESSCPAVFDAQFSDPVGVSPENLIQQNWNVVLGNDEKFGEMFSGSDAVHECDRRTDKMTITFSALVLYPVKRSGSNWSTPS